MLFFGIECKECEHRIEADKIPDKVVELEKFLEKPCPKCGGQMFRPLDGLSIQTPRYSRKRRAAQDEKWAKKSSKMKEDAAVKKDPYHGLR